MEHCVSCGEGLDEAVITPPGSNTKYHAACLMEFIHRSNQEYVARKDDSGVVSRNVSSQERCTTCDKHYHSVSSSSLDSSDMDRSSIFETREVKHSSLMDNVDDGYVPERASLRRANKEKRAAHEDVDGECTRQPRSSSPNCSHQKSDVRYNESNRSGSSKYCNHYSNDKVHRGKSKVALDDDRSKAYYKTTVESDDQTGEPTSKQRTASSEDRRTVYIPDLPTKTLSDYDLEKLIASRIEEVSSVKPKKVQCFARLGIGVVEVADELAEQKLLNLIGQLALNPKEKPTIRFVDTIQLVSFLVLHVPKDYSAGLPTAAEVSRRWVELHRGEPPLSCEVLTAQFPCIFRVVSTSLDELTRVTPNAPFRIKNLLGEIYHCAEQCFFEEVPRTVKEEGLRSAISDAIGRSDLPATALGIRINRQTATACVISTNNARSWSAVSSIKVEKQTLQKRTHLPCRLLLSPVTGSLSVQEIAEHRDFGNCVKQHKLVDDRLMLEISNQTVFEDCLRYGALRLEKGELLCIDLCHSLDNPDDGEINEDTWYNGEMLGIRPDIMPFVGNPKHKIFRFRWNASIWNEQFKRTAHPRRDDPNSAKKPTPDRLRHLLRVTVMLNTLAVIRKRKYSIDDREIQLNLKNELTTIVYDHTSTLERREKLALTKTPYSHTTVRVVEQDCLVEYGRMVEYGKRPVLLNMASPTSPGGGFRQGDGAQEENIFRRSDYYRSLDVDLDDFLKERPDRKHCTSECRLQTVPDPNNMYPMDEYGAIYTSGITVFRQTEETGYALMKTPLENVCAIAMAAYCDPDLRGSFLAPKYAVRTRKKIENIFAIAQQHKHDCIILSAFGCGAFRNPPEHMAELFLSVIEQYAGFFETIVFAIVDDHNTGRELNRAGNFRPFANILDGRIVSPSREMNEPNTIVGPYRLLSDGSTVADVTIFGQTPCNYGAQCTEMYNQQHSSQFSHPPLCIEATSRGECLKSDDPVHATSFIHRRQCPDGGLCRKINDEDHNRQEEHPDLCPDGGRCRNQKSEHLKQYRHVPLCEKAHKCMEYQKGVASHCDKLRHCAPHCSHGSTCVLFHDKSHLDDCHHPFPVPCPRTPFDCPHYLRLASVKDTRTLPLDVSKHCLDYAHVCKDGRQCTNNTALHASKTIHIMREKCAFGETCRRLDDEEHLNAFSHPNVPDIRPACRHGDACRDVSELKHRMSFWHPPADIGGVVRLHGSNNGTNFVENQTNSNATIAQYVASNGWKPLPLESIPSEILNWVRTVQPIHRCNPLIFQSILLHGHVMSREYMDHLKNVSFVVGSVLHHSRIQRIEELKTKSVEQDARMFVTALVASEFEKRGLPTADAVSSTMLPADASTSYSTLDLIKRKENKLKMIMPVDDVAALRAKAIEIARASIQLHINPAGIGHLPDKALGTDKLVFSVLGPHLGHYYGDVIFVFKRQILHHPDANYTVQAATSFASGNAYKWRPWLGNDPGPVDERVAHYHRTKLHVGVPGYEYTTALELMTLARLRKKSTSMDVTLEDILDEWVKTDSHHNVEAHLPQLIPLDYIDHIYIPTNLFDELDENSKKAIGVLFKGRITMVPHKGQANQDKEPFGPTPAVESRSQYQDFVIKELHESYTKNATRLPARLIQGFAMTIAPSGFEQHYVLPLTISQAYTQYRTETRHSGKENITYLYWKAIVGDMMLTLSNEKIDLNEAQPSLRSLICYIAPQPLPSDDDYHEQTSYLAAAHPFEHAKIRNKKLFKAKSNDFYRGCNGSDFMTFCLQVHRSTGKVILSHAGPNSIYNRQEIACTFGRSELDLSQMEFVHLSAGAHVVPIHNLIIRFEKDPSLHPTFDKNYQKADATHSTSDHQAAASTDAADKATAVTEPGFMDKLKQRLFGDDSPKPCLDNVNCLKQYGNDAVAHNTKNTHPCPFSERCRERSTHTTHTHDPHLVPLCPDDAGCDRLDDAFHRAAYRHTGRPDFLRPCRLQDRCADKSSTHRKKYSHGEDLFNLPVRCPAASNKHNDHHAQTDPTPCKWGASCHDKSTAHHAKYSHTKK